MDIDSDLVPWLHGLHATAGGIALFAAPLAMMVHKGGTWHRRWGKTFVWSMVVVCITAVIMGIIHPDRFWLALVAVFSFHLIASGYRALYLKNLHRGLRPKGIDLALHGTAAIVNGGLLIWGLAYLFLDGHSTQAILFTVFGLIGSATAANGFLRFFRRRHDKREWLYAHMAGFLGGYIATVSAFSAVNLTMIKPTWLQRLWPTIIGVPLIFLWTARYKRRFKMGERLREMADVRIR